VKKLDLVDHCSRFLEEYRSGSIMRLQYCTVTKARQSQADGSGYKGVKAHFLVVMPCAKPHNIATMTIVLIYSETLALLQHQDTNKFLKSHVNAAVSSHRTLYNEISQLPNPSP